MNSWKLAFSLQLNSSPGPKSFQLFLWKGEKVMKVILAAGPGSPHWVYLVATSCVCIHQDSHELLTTHTQLSSWQLEIKKQRYQHRPPAPIPGGMEDMAAGLVLPRRRDGGTPGKCLILIPPGFPCSNCNNVQPRVLKMLGFAWNVTPSSYKL